MEKIASSVRITEEASVILANLSAQMGQPKAKIIEEALRRLEERVFWDGVRKAFASPETEELRRERELWDQTANDGLRGDSW
ncbi:MAG: hypothetical protein ABI823_21175 [Bryobacteraceae bacterium]